MGNGASVQKFHTPTDLNDALLSEPAFEKEAAACTGVVARMDKRFKMVDKSSTGFVTMQDIHALPLYRVCPAMDKVFFNGFVQNPPAKAIDFDTFLSPVHAFTGHGNIQSKIRFVFSVIAEQKKEMTLAQFLSMAEALGMTVDTNEGLASEFEGGRITITEDEFVAFMLKELTEDDAKDIFDFDLAELLPGSPS